MQPSSPASYGPQELAQDLRRLMELPAQTKAEQSHWYDEAQRVQDRIKTSEEPEPVNASETVSSRDYCVAFSEAESRAGSFIQTEVGGAFGTGAPRGKRSG